jgi:hypothetical protein
LTDVKARWIAFAFILVALIGVAAALPRLFDAARWTTPSGSFAPLPSQTGSVQTLAVIGDFGSCVEGGCIDEQAVADLVLSWEPARILTVGDNNYPNGSANTFDRNIARFYGDYLGPGDATGPRFLPVLGNHDWDCAQCPRPYLDYFELPGIERYYTIELSPDLRIFGLDSDPREPDGTTADSVQATWLRKELAASTARWNLVLLHHPPYSSGNHGSSIELRWPFAAWGASAVLAGHAHDYERLTVDGIPYIVAGTGGAELKPFDRPLKESDVRIADTFGALKVLVSATSLVIEFWSVDGVLADRTIVGNEAAVPSPTPSAAPSPNASPTPVAAAPPSDRVTAFYYDWYGAPPIDADYRHWAQGGHTPPGDLGSAFMPSLGAYSSNDPAVLADHMAALRQARVGTIAVSWWGAGSFEDAALPGVLDAAATADIGVALHLEPYQGRTAASIGADIASFIDRFGAQPGMARATRPTAWGPSDAPRPIVYLYLPREVDASELRGVLDDIRGTDHDAIVLIHTTDLALVDRVHADGLYTYDVYAIDGSRFDRLLTECVARHVLCSPSVGPGYDEGRATGGDRVIDRADGERYATMWAYAIDAAADWVSITSFNEWHEGTQIEAARSAGPPYLDYEGDFDRTGISAEAAYLDATATWVDVLMGD